MKWTAKQRSHGCEPMGAAPAGAAIRGLSHTQRNILTHVMPFKLLAPFAVLSAFARNAFHPARLSGWPNPNTSETPANQPFRVNPDHPKLPPGDKTCHSPTSKPPIQTKNPSTVFPLRLV